MRKKLNQTKITSADNRGDLEPISLPSVVYSIWLGR